MARSRYEKRAQKELEEEGWNVDWKYRPPRATPYYSPDFWGVFDLMAVKNGEIRFISIKGRAGIPSAHKEEIKSFKVPKGCSKEAWARSQSKKRDHYWHKITFKEIGEKN